MQKESPVYFSKFFIVISLLVFVFAIYVFFAISYGIGIVNGNSMAPTLKKGSVFVYVKETDIERMNIVAIKNKTTEETIVKRIIGLPFEVVKIKEGVIYINGEQIEDVIDVYTYPGSNGDCFVLGSNEYFVIGDNRETSIDSRTFGAVRREEILGVLVGN